jgi:hypothetical protein
MSIYIHERRDWPQFRWNNGRLASMLAAGKAFLIPDDILRRELAGESPVKLWRIQRNLTQQELSGRAGISKS